MIFGFLILTIIYPLGKYWGISWLPVLKAFPAIFLAFNRRVPSFLLAGLGDALLEYGVFSGGILAFTIFHLIFLDKRLPPPLYLLTLFLFPCSYLPYMPYVIYAFFLVMALTKSFGPAYFLFALSDSLVLLQLINPDHWGWLQILSLPLYWISLLLLAQKLIDKK